KGGSTRPSTESRHCATSTRAIPMWAMTYTSSLGVTGSASRWTGTRCRYIRAGSMTTRGFDIVGTDYRPGRRPVKRGPARSACIASPVDRAGRDVDRGREEGGVEDERPDAVGGGRAAE